MRSHQSILYGSVVGVFFVFLAQSIVPLTILLPDSTREIDPAGVIIIYLAIPIIVGAMTGYVENENPRLNGFSSGLVSGVVNLFVSLVEQFNFRNTYSSDIQNQFGLFALMLAFLWSILAAFSAKFSTWSPR